MPFSMRIEPDAGIVIGTCSGTLGLDDAREGAMAVWGNPEWSDKPVVWDFRSASLDVRGPEVREIARFVLDRQPSSPPPKVAFVIRTRRRFRPGPDVRGVPPASVHGGADVPGL